MFNCSFSTYVFFRAYSWSISALLPVSQQVRLFLIRYQHSVFYQHVKHLQKFIVYILQRIHPIPIDFFRYESNILTHTCCFCINTIFCLSRLFTCKDDKVSNCCGIYRIQHGQILSCLIKSTVFSLKHNVIDLSTDII